MHIKQIRNLAVLGIILISLLLTNCVPAYEEKATPSIAPAIERASHTPTHTLTLAPEKTLPDKILEAVNSGSRISHDDFSGLDEHWFVNADYIASDGRNIQVFGEGGWEGYLLNTNGVRSGEAILVSFMLTDDISCELGFRIGSESTFGVVGFDEKTTFGVYLNTDGIGSSLWNRHAFIERGETIELHGLSNMIKDHAYTLFGAIGEDSGVIAIWEQDNPSAYVIYSPDFLEDWEVQEWFFFVNTNLGSVVIDNYDEWLIDFDTAGIDKFVSVSTEGLSASSTMIPAPTPAPIPKTSYEASITSIFVETNGNDAVGYADFNQDGLNDILVAFISGTSDKIPITMFIQKTSGTFSREDSLLPSPLPGTVHPRKIVIADFNSDNIPDAFIADHGLDKPPFPGSEPLLLLSADDGFEVRQISNVPTGFHHSATSADITGDGSPDIFVIDPTNGSFFLLNDGSGNFTLTRDGLPDIRDAYFSSELIDLDDDGFYDLLVGGHEEEGADTRVYWGDATGTFSIANSTGVPNDAEYSIVLDFDSEDLYGDGARELVVTRTKFNPFYEGYYFQMLEMNKREFIDVSNRIVPERATWEGSTAQWVNWIILRDFNNDGYLDLVVPDRGRDLVYLNDGSGIFVRKP